MPKLTKTLIDSIAEPSVETWIPCSELPGFYVRARPSRRKTYVVRYRNAAGTQRKYTIGRVSDMPPEKARELARKVFGAVAEGKDPAADRTALREAPTVADLKERYMREHAYTAKKAGSAKNDETNWRLHILPAIGKKKVVEVVKADVNDIRNKLVDRKSAANACVALISKAMNLAEEWGWRPKNSNPCHRYKKFDIQEKEFILDDDQMVALDRALVELVEERDIPYAMAALVRLWLITGCRNSEIRTAERAWIDFSRQLLLLPDSKGGQRRIPLPDSAIAIIRTLPEGRWLIPGRIKGQHLKSPWGMFKRICKRAGIPLVARPHDLRHTAGSIGHHGGLSQRQIATQLGHKQLSTTERYIHGIRSAAGTAATVIAEAVTKNFGQ